MTGRMTTAYAGSGDITPENVAATLNALLPDKLGKLFIPAGVIRPRTNPGLKKVIKWLEEDEMGVGPDALFPEDNLVKAMVARNEELASKGEEPDELVLVMVPDPASGLDNSLIKEAHEAGIRVVDLTQAGDDIVPGEPEPEEPAAEEEPPFETDETPAEAAPSPAEVIEAAKEKAVAAAVAAQEAKAREAGREAGLAAAENVREREAKNLVFSLSISVPPESVLTFARVLADAMAAQQTAQKFTMGPEGDIVPAVSVTAPPARAGSLNVTPITSAPSLPKDKDPQPEGTVVYYYNESEAKYRPARGRKRDNEERVFLTPEEVAQAKEKGMLK